MVMISISESLDRAVCKALKSRVVEPRYRVFRNNSLDYVACRRAPEIWSQEKVPSHRKLAQHFGDTAYLAVNEVAKWDAGLCLDLRRLIESNDAFKHFKNANLVDTYTFISSSSGWTPFGAHVDFEHSIIVGVSGKRIIYTWEIGEQIGQLKSDALSFLGLSFDYLNRINSAKKYNLDPGDVLKIEKLKGHVFYATDPGMFIGLSYIDDCSSENNGIHSAELIPTKDPELLDFLKENSKEKICWSYSAEVLGDRITNQKMYFQLSKEKVSIALEIKIFLTESEDPTFEKCLAHFQTKSIDVESFLLSCAKIGAVYVL